MLNSVSLWNSNLSDLSDFVVPWTLCGFQNLLKRCKAFKELKKKKLHDKVALSFPKKEHMNNSSNWITCFTTFTIWKKEKKKSTDFFIVYLHAFIYVHRINSYEDWLPRRINKYDTNHSKLG